MALILLAGWCSIEVAQAQAKRWVLLENFTNTGCGPCAQGNPIMLKTINSNLTKVHNISFHVNWPSASDPMYMANTASNTARTKYYKVSAVPTVKLNGTKWSGSSGDVTQSLVDNYYSANTSPMEIVVQQSGSGTTRNVKVIVHTVGTIPAGTYKIRAAVVEKKISYTSAPGSNGEKEFHNVFRTFINKDDTAGETITFPTINDSLVLNYQYTISSAWKAAEMHVVAYVQNTAKEVLNSGSTMDETVITGVDNQENSSATGNAFPNPAHQAVYIPVNVKSTNARLQVWDVQGRLVAIYPLSVGEQNFSFNTEFLSAGTYIYRVTDNNNVSEAKQFLIER